jgi:hypothetical protein
MSGRDLLWLDERPLVVLRGTHRHAGVAHPPSMIPPWQTSLDGLMEPFSMEWGLQELITFHR